MTRPGRLGRLLPLLVFLITGAVFLPALRGEFLDWDDSVNFVANPHYRGLGWPQIKWMLTARIATAARAAVSRSGSIRSPWPQYTRPKVPRDRKSVV